MDDHLVYIEGENWLSSFGFEKKSFCSRSPGTFLTNRVWSQAPPGPTLYARCRRLRILHKPPE